MIGRQNALIMMIIWSKVKMLVIDELLRGIEVYKCKNMSIRLLLLMMMHWIYVYSIHFQDLCLILDIVAITLPITSCWHMFESKHTTVSCNRCK